ncbi:MAG: alpha/beta hydrolase [Phycisphaerales bacterium]
MVRALWFARVVAVGLIAGPLGATPEPRDTPALTLEEKEIIPEGGRVLVGTFRVPENRETREGRTLELEIMLLPATGDDPQPDPVIYLAGGPGQNAAQLWGGYRHSWMREDRDILFVSQRGTGGNNRLTCELDGEAGADDHPDDLQRYLDPGFNPDAVRECLDRLSRAFDLRWYTTPVAMDDLDELCGLLGYEQVNLLGGSYGTRAALVFMRRHPDRVRSAILNGVAPIAFTNPLFHAEEAQAALDRIIDECAADPRCAEAFPDLRDKFEATLARLEAAPARVTVTHPDTGVEVEVTLTREGFAEAFRVLMYYDSRSIPVLIERAHRGEFAYFAQRGIESNRGLRDSLAFGMLLCVTCAEDIPRIDRERIDELTRDTFMGDGRVRRQIAICDLWPRGVVPDDYGEPVAVDTPTLIISGRLDPVTGPRWGDETARHLPNALHVVAPGSHGVGGACIESITRAFLERASVEELDISCVESMREGPFVMP